VGEGLFLPNSAAGSFEGAIVRKPLRRHSHRRITVDNHIVKDTRITARVDELEIPSPGGHGHGELISRAKVFASEQVAFPGFVPDGGHMNFPEGDVRIVLKRYVSLLCRHGRRCSQKGQHRKAQSQDFQTNSAAHWETSFIESGLSALHSTPCEKQSTGQICANSRLSVCMSPKTFIFRFIPRWP